jgi:hypothetical protein
MRFFDRDNVSKRLWGPDVQSGAGTVTPDLSKGRLFNIAYTAATLTIANPLNAGVGMQFRLFLKNFVGGITITWGSYFKHPGGSITPTGTTGKTDIVDCVVDAAPDTVDVTLTGSSGTASIGIKGVIVGTATWNTSLTQTAADFVTTNQAAFTAAGIRLGSSSAVITLTSINPQKKFDKNVVITNLTLTLNGTAADTTLPYIIRTQAILNYTP